MNVRAHKSITAGTLDRLRDAILRAEYPPGQKLRIEQIARSLDVSIGAVREALSRLTAEGMVIAEPQRGFVVTPISRRDLTELTAVRIEVETRCLDEAILHGDLDWEGRVQSARHKLKVLGRAYESREEPGATQWHTLHELFHDELASGCPNQWWLKLRQQLYIQSERYRRLAEGIAGPRRDVPAEHDAIADAAIARNRQAARQAMTDHLGRTTEVILNAPLQFADADHR
ncbi:MAG: GntR family transcriptional regulator [Rhodobacterales bacterium]|nr:GntR family transcriptional regulator [Rhodobacterales bacterium]